MHSRQSLIQLNQYNQQRNEEFQKTVSYFTKETTTSNHFFSTFANLIYSLGVRSRKNMKQHVPTFLFFLHRINGQRYKFCFDEFDRKTTVAKPFNDIKLQFDIMHFFLLTFAFKKYFFFRFHTVDIV